MEFDYWEVETPVGAEEGKRTRTPLAEGIGEIQAMDATTEESVLVVDDDPPA